MSGYAEIKLFERGEDGQAILLASARVRNGEPLGMALWLPVDRGYLLSWGIDVRDIAIAIAQGMENEGDS